jgi:hypothetical protein
MGLTRAAHMVDLRCEKCGERFEFVLQAGLWTNEDIKVLKSLGDVVMVPECENCSPYTGGRSWSRTFFQLQGIVRDATKEFEHRDLIGV